MAAGLETASLRGQGRTADAIAALEGLAGAGRRRRPGDGRPGAELCRGRRPRRRRRATSTACSPRIRRASPARLMQAGLDQLARRPGGRRGRLPRGDRRRPGPAAGATRRSTPSSLGQGRAAEAEAALDAGLAARAATARRCVFAKAGLLEARGDIDGAIAAYETLYAARQRLAGARQQPREPARELPRRPGEPRARLRHRPAAARLGACRSSRTPTAGSCTAAATTTRRSATSPRPPRRCPATRWCSSTSPRPSSRSAAAPRRAPSFARALAAAEAGSPLPQLEIARARIAEIDEAARGG